MILYSISDAPGGIIDDGWCIAVWSDDHDSAVRFAAERCKQECGEYMEMHVLAKRAESPDCLPAKGCTHEERGYAELRRAGWREEGEGSCDTCGLYPMGLDRFAICEHCGQCPECADDDCPVCSKEREEAR